MNYTIRKFKRDEINAVMKIWLESNIETHPFISPEYWENNYVEVKNAILEAEIYVAENNGHITGFIGLIQNYIAGLFVNRAERDKGIGTELIEQAKRIKENLELNVYKENLKAVRFYHNHGFEIAQENVDETTCHIEYKMTWKRDKEYIDQ